MRKTVVLVLAAGLLLMLTACSRGETTGDMAAETSEITGDTAIETSHTAASEQDLDSSDKTSVEAGSRSSSSNILIAYFSVPEDVDTPGTDAVAGASVVMSEGKKLGNTEYVAQLIHKTVGGNLFRIETEESYPLDHEPLVEQAAGEQDEKYRPALSAQVENFEQYDTILVGYPNWWGDMPMPVYSFLEEYDFDGKTIIPFMIHGGSGASGTIETISELQPGALIRDQALVLSRNAAADSEEEVTAWAEGLGLSAVPEPEGQ